MSFSVSYSSNIVCITPSPRFDAILSQKSGRGFSRYESLCGGESVPLEGHITTHKISPELGLKTVLFPQKSEIATQTR